MKQNIMIDRYVPGRECITNRQHGRWPDVRVRRPSREKLTPRKSVSGHRITPYRFPPVNATTQRFSPVGLASGESKKPDPSLPKNFDKPMTCFFWHQFGRCNKRDVDCAYAHWDTGFMAGAPINLLGATESVAGKNAERHTVKEDPEATRLWAELQALEDALSKRKLEIEETEKEIAKREENLTKKMRGEERELSLREKKVARREEALRKAATSTK